MALFCPSRGSDSLFLAEFPQYLGSGHRPIGIGISEDRDRRPEFDARLGTAWNPHFLCCGFDSVVLRLRRHRIDHRPQLLADADPVRCLANHAKHTAAYGQTVGADLPDGASGMNVSVGKKDFGAVVICADRANLADERRADQVRSATALRLCLLLARGFDDRAA